MSAPRKEVDVEKLRLLAAFGLTQRECARILECSEDTIQRHYLADYEAGLDTCRASLRRKQFEIAMSGKPGAVTMLIWLGKNLLGQTDKAELTGKNGAPLMPSVDREELLGKLLGPGFTSAKPTVQ